MGALVSASDPKRPKPQAEQCVFCRVGSCGIHHVLRLVPSTAPEGVPDEQMLEIGCCDELELALRVRFIRRDPGAPGRLCIPSRGIDWPVRVCPFCGGSKMTTNDILRMQADERAQRRLRGKS